jgi:DNA-binding MarR family transcriptional regulator
MSMSHDMRVGALDRILELVVVLHEDATRTLARQGLTVSRAPVLWQLRRRGPARQRDLADAMGISPRTLTELVDALVETGFVTREPHPTDRRANLITLTDRGISTIETLERQQDEFVDVLFASMRDDRFQCFVDGLEHVLERLHALGLSAEHSDTE